jgi:hypothetical protein
MIKTRENIVKIIDESPFGLTSREIALQARVREESAGRMLRSLAAKKKIRMTVSGKDIFFRSMKLAIFVLFLVIPASSAQNFSSANYTLTATILDSAGGNSSTLYNKTILLSVGQVSGRRSLENYEFCSGFLCSFYDYVAIGRVTFMLAFNISGNENDAAYVDTFTDTRDYNPEEIINQYVCMDDTSLSNSPVFGIIFSGSRLNSIKLIQGNSYIMRVSQDIPGNKFIIPVTSGNCSVINTRIPQIIQYGTILQPFVIVNEAINAIELALNYRAFDIAGSFDRTGAFKLIVEKNETNENQIIIKPE